MHWMLPISVANQLPMRCLSIFCLAPRAIYSVLLLHDRYMRDMCAQAVMHSWVLGIYNKPSRSLLYLYVLEASF